MFKLNFNHQLRLILYLSLSIILILPSCSTKQNIGNPSQLVEYLSSSESSDRIQAVIKLINLGEEALPHLLNDWPNRSYLRELLISELHENTISHLVDQIEHESDPLLISHLLDAISLNNNISEEHVLSILQSLNQLAYSDSKIIELLSKIIIKANCNTAAVKEYLEDIINIGFSSNNTISNNAINSIILSYGYLNISKNDLIIEKAIRLANAKSSDYQISAAFLLYNIDINTEGNYSILTQAINEITDASDYEQLLLLFKAFILINDDKSIEALINAHSVLNQRDSRLIIWAIEDFGVNNKNVKIVELFLHDIQVVPVPQIDAIRALMFTKINKQQALELLESFSNDTNSVINQSAYPILNDAIAWLKYTT
ncbi:MAG TPA: hypothetical protein VGB30_09780 [bacterium]|jgi:hypothetical protein